MNKGTPCHASDLPLIGFGSGGSFSAMRQSSEAEMHWRIGGIGGGFWPRLIAAPAGAWLVLRACRLSTAPSRTRARHNCRRLAMKALFERSFGTT